ncbi:hypothetical protein SVIO_056600 [Streptomyces violaceusniger]|uniref:Uncharacterized protein n=1 Tax=Streptomyces violaceusniger TaxID=68280 RepID=A0A4D4L8S7_STRVO|nr:hypothetical protein SVIO_056600 [Streptomyces violaceusniger]
MREGVPLRLLPHPVAVVGPRIALARLVGGVRLLYRALVAGGGLGDQTRGSGPCGVGGCW